MSAQELVTQVVRLNMALRNESQADLARALGVAPPAVSKKFRGRLRWSLDDLERLAEHYALPLDAFLRPTPPAWTEREPAAAKFANGSYRTPARGLFALAA